MARTKTNQAHRLGTLGARLAASWQLIHTGAASRCLHGRTLVLARAVWLSVATLVCVMFGVSMWVWAGEVRGPCPTGVCQQGPVQVAEAHAFTGLHLAVSFEGWYSIGLSALFAAGFTAPAALMFWRRSHDLLALYLSLALLVFGALTPFNSGPVARLGEASAAWRLLVQVLQLLGASAFGAVGYVFPDGRFVPRWTRIAAVAVGLWFMPAYLWPDSPFSFNTWPPTATFGGLVCFFGAAGIAQVYRYRRVSTLVQRQQTKWVVLGILLAAIGYLVGWLLLRLSFTSTLISPGSVLAALGGNTLIYVSLLLIPICLSIAILRYHLFDIDVLIRRTLIYGMLTSMLALIYASSVLGGQAVVQALWGRHALPPVIIVVSTLLIAALCQPLRGWVQRGIDRRFYRRKYDATRTVAEFGQVLRREVDLAQLTGQLLAVVDDTMRPSQVSLWLLTPRVRTRQEAAGTELCANGSGSAEAGVGAASKLRVRVKAFGMPDGHTARGQADKSAQVPALPPVKSAGLPERSTRVMSLPYSRTGSDTPVAGSGAAPSRGGA